MVHKAPLSKWTYIISYPPYGYEQHRWRDGYDSGSGKNREKKSSWQTLAGISTTTIADDTKMQRNRYKKGGSCTLLPYVACLATRNTPVMLSFKKLTPMHNSIATAIMGKKICTPLSIIMKQLLAMKYLTQLKLLSVNVPKKKASQKLIKNTKTATAFQGTLFVANVEIPSSVESTQPPPVIMSLGAATHTLMILRVAPCNTLKLQVLKGFITMQNKLVNARNKY